MSKRAQIFEAFCVELDEVISITKARRAYFSMPEPRVRFRFLCANRSCLLLELPPKITGVNYSSLPTDTYRAAHFRDPGETHADDCPWQSAEASKDGSTPPPGESHEDTNSREAKRKLHDYIDEFDPTPGKASTVPKRPSDIAESPITEDVSKQRSGRNNSYTNRNNTSSFERLVEYYRNAQKDLTPHEFYALRLKVAGMGVMPLVSYFPSVSRALPEQPMRVIHGGAKLDVRKDTGFMLWFYDRVDNKKVYLRVSGQEMDEYRFHGFFNEILSHDRADYFKVFALGRLVLSATGKSYRLEVGHLRYLTLFAVQRKNKSRSK